VQESTVILTASALLRLLLAIMCLAELKHTAKRTAAAIEMETMML
jgi:hypothetical protein